MIFVNTNLAAAAGAVLAMITSWTKFGKPEVGMSLNGALAGLVAITAPCASVTPLSAVFIGAAAGIIVVLSVLFLDKIKVDDPVGRRLSARSLRCLGYSGGRNIQHRRHLGQNHRRPAARYWCLFFVGISSRISYV